jgi:hypothetical protein
MYNQFNYHAKYLKYKQKYLALKDIIDDNITIKIAERYTDSRNMCKNYLIHFLRDHNFSTVSGDTISFYSDYVDVSGNVIPIFYDMFEVIGGINLYRIKGKLQDSILITITDENNEKLCKLCIGIHNSNNKFIVNLSNGFIIKK